MDKMNPSTVQGATYGSAAEFELPPNRLTFEEDLGNDEYIRVERNNEYAMVSWSTDLDFVECVTYLSALSSSQMNMATVYLDSDQIVDSLNIPVSELSKVLDDTDDLVLFVTIPVDGATFSWRPLSEALSPPQRRRRQVALAFHSLRAGVRTDILQKLGSPSVSKQALAFLHRVEVTRTDVFALEQ